MICDLDNIDEIIMKEGLNLLVVSYDWSASICNQYIRKK